MPKIVFVNPPLSLNQRYGKLASAGNTLPPLGLLYLAGIARLKNNQVAIVDASNKPNFKEAAKEIMRHQPRYIAITATTLSIHSAANLAKAIKEENSRLTVIVGGPHITAVPQETMERFPEFDIGVIGEGEEALVDLLHIIEDGGKLDNVNGIVYRDDGKIVLTKERSLIGNLDTLPFPAWDLLPEFPRGYQPVASKFQKLPAAYILSSRGCPYKCIFCDSSVFRSKCRFFSAKYVIEMIKFLYQRYGVREISFEDDTLLLYKERLIDICESLLKENISLSWSCNGRVDAVDLPLLKLMRKAGCWQIGYGIESGVQSILDLSKKNIRLEQIEKAVELTYESGILSKGFFILGFPTETRRTIRQTIDFSKRIKLDDITVSCMTPFPGSELYKIAKEYGEFDEDWKKMNLIDIVYVPYGLTRGYLKENIKQGMKEFYFRPRIIKGYILRIIKNPVITSKVFKGLLAFLKTVFSNEE